MDAEAMLWHIAHPFMEAPVPKSTEEAESETISESVPPQTESALNPLPAPEPESEPELKPEQPEETESNPAENQNTPASVSSAPVQPTEEEKENQPYTETLFSAFEHMFPDSASEQPVISDDMLAAEIETIFGTSEPPKTIPHDADDSARPNAS